MSRQKPWKNTSFGHLETRLFTIKNLQKMQVLGGAHGTCVPVGWSSKVSATFGCFCGFIVHVSFNSHCLTCYWLGGKRVDPMDPVETQRCLKLGQNVQSSNHPEKNRKNVFSSFRISYKFPMCHGQKKTSWSCGMFAQHHMAIWFSKIENPKITVQKSSKVLQIRNWWIWRRN